MPIEIREFHFDFAGAWDDFVRAHPHGSPFHLLAWKRCLERTFGYKPYYRLALEGGRIAAVLPLFLSQNPITGKTLISTPFAVYGGILAASGEARDALRHDIEKLGERLQVQYLDLRNAYEEQCVGWARVERYVTFTRAVKPQETDDLLKDIPKKTRNMIRKALKTPFEVRRVRDWRRFERLHSLTLRRLGTPSFPPAHFAGILENFGDMVDVCEVDLEGKLAGASLSFLFKGEMHIYYAATDPELNHLAPNYRMYFEHLMWAGQQGYALFDFGRSKLNTGTFDFKRHWDTVQRELPYEIFLVRRKDMPNFSPVNPKFDLAIRAWRRLPLALTRSLGPYFIRLFP